MRYSNFGEVNTGDLKTAITYLEETRAAADRWVSGDCHKNDPETSWVRCGDDSPQDHRNKCCIATDNPPRARAAIRILNRMRDSITDSDKPEARTLFTSALRRLEGFFGSVNANFSDDSGYQNSTWQGTSATLATSIAELKEAYNILTGRFLLIVIVGVIICISAALIYYYR